MVKGTKKAVQKRVAKAKRTAKVKKAAVKSPRFNSPINEEDRALFLHHLGNLPKLIKAKDDAVNSIRNFYKAAKADGFLKIDFDDGRMIQKAEGEKAKKAAIARSLTIAKWLGCDLGAQLDLFVEDERVPAVDHAFEAGKTASMQNKAAKPPYDPDTEQFRQYMAGFHEHQATLAKGIKKLHPAVKEDVKATANQKAATDQQKAQDAKNFDGPNSGTPVSREDYKKMQAEGPR